MDGEEEREERRKKRSGMGEALSDEMSRCYSQTLTLHPQVPVHRCPPDDHLLFFYSLASCLINLPRADLACLQRPNWGNRSSRLLARAIVLCTQNRPERAFASSTVPGGHSDFPHQGGSVSSGQMLQSAVHSTSLSHQHATVRAVSKLLLSSEPNPRRPAHPYLYL